MSVHFRDNDCQGAISYGKAFTYIILIFFYAALISTVVKYIYFKYLDPAYLENMFQITMEAMETIKLPVSSTEMTEQTEQLLKPFNYSLATIWVNVIMGAVVGLIMAAFIKKDKNIFEE